MYTNKKNLNMELKKITEVIEGLATVAVLSMDLSVPYNKSEEKIYTNKLFQALVVFSVAYNINENIDFAFAVTLIWYVIKNVTKVL